MANSNVRGRTGAAQRREAEKSRGSSASIPFVDRTQSGDPFRKQNRNWLKRWGLEAWSRRRANQDRRFRIGTPEAVGERAEVTGRRGWVEITALNGRAAGTFYGNHVRSVRRVLARLVERLQAERRWTGRRAAIRIADVRRIKRSVAAAGGKHYALRTAAKEAMISSTRPQKSISRQT